MALRDGWRCRRGRRARCGRGGGAAAGAATGPSPCALRSDVHTVRCFALTSKCQLLVHLGSFLHALFNRGCADAVPAVAAMLGTAGMPAHPSSACRPVAAPRSIPVDFIEREKEYVLRADIPGVHKARAAVPGAAIVWVC